MRMGILLSVLPAVLDVPFRNKFSCFYCRCIKNTKIKKILLTRHIIILPLNKWLLIEIWHVASALINRFIRNVFIFEVLVYRYRYILLYVYGFVYAYTYTYKYFNNSPSTPRRTRSTIRSNWNFKLFPQDVPNLLIWLSKTTYKDDIKTETKKYSLNLYKVLRACRSTASFHLNITHIICKWSIADIK